MPVPTLPKEVKTVLAVVEEMTPEKVAVPAVALYVPAAVLLTPTVILPTVLYPVETVPAPVKASTRTLASEPAKVAPDATFKLERLFVQTSLLFEPPTKVPA